MNRTDLFLQPLKPSKPTKPDMPTPSPRTAPASGPVVPEIDASDLAAVRRFLTSYRDEQRRERVRRPFGGSDPNGPALRHGIARARQRSAPKPEN
jgi:hypothetical protein